MNQKNNPFWGTIGFVLIFYGMLFPALTTDWSLYIFEEINRSLNEEDSGKLLVTAFSYITRNTITFSMVFFGALFLAGYITGSIATLRFQAVYIAIALSALFGINFLYKEYYSFLPYLLTIGAILFFSSYLPKQRYFVWTFLILLTLTTISFQWLNLIPSLSDYGFGQNDISVSLKAVDDFLTDHNLFNTITLLFFLIFFVIAVIFTTLIHLFSKQIATLKLYQAQGKELQRIRNDLIESKVYQEMHTLVHDLKTPLVSVEGLLSLMEMKVPDTDEKTKSYYNRISRSITRMKDMISDILYEDVRKELPAQQLMDYVLSHLSTDDLPIQFEMNIAKDVPLLHVNKIRFARAISNILENSMIYLTDRGGKISIEIYQENGQTYIQIEDNGPGIEQANLVNIWQEGFSTKNSSGIGLPFVKRVVENHLGNIEVVSKPGSHTRTTITLPNPSRKETVS
ncbi:sensor histidine kinase [Thalassobacillus pellis]|uniref:sensor histidine kinase n=1 Tax=Thalassobacillus pellis TaxID=748008 RepID=UPI0019602E42|nr:HAMP domain-containing sensor histidine kinase [Thalassobacillus pellis]MBM7551360.1 signal transduction histidine kinase [Thalassobacillus pellis]